MTPAPDAGENRKLRDVTSGDLARYAARHGLAVSGDDEVSREQTAQALLHRVQALLAVIELLDEIEDPAIVGGHPRRDPGRTPESDEDPYNSIVRFCDVRGAEEGPLAGWRIGVKDNIAVAGVPMTRGDATASPRLPSRDAVVVERLLGAGGRVVATTNINDAFGVARNPLNPRYFAGGSSSGSAAAVASGLLDAALGGDQGGSLRIPAAWCGIVGMKATHGLVPSYGLSYWDHTLDHIGPMTGTVAENATFLQVLAGADWRDPQWVRGDPVSDDYMAAQDQGVAGLRVGVVLESLEPSGCTDATLEAFDDAQRILRRCGADVVQISVPLWTDALPIWFAGLTAGLTAMRESFGQGYGHLGAADPELVAAAAADYWGGQDVLPFEDRALPLVYERVREAGLGTHFARAQNLRLELRRQLDAALADTDLLLTPTTPAGPPEVIDAFPATRGRPEDQYGPVANNTCPLNLTGHPALTVPSGRGDNDLPVGLQIVGRRFAEQTVYRAGFAVEAALAD